MSQEEKQLLFKDLCSRLPYGVRVHRVTSIGIEGVELLGLDWIGEFCAGECELKPYLRPLSLMTEEEKNEYERIFENAHWETSSFGSNDKVILSIDFMECYDNDEGIKNVYNIIPIKPIDWLNAHHFDFRGLIKKGLALEASDKMYK